MDWNSDGDADLISGDRNGYFNVWVWDDTGFVAYTQYQLTDSTPLNVGYNSYPTVIDWNGDGMKDLLLGCENGQVLLWSNVGSDTWPMFQDAETLEAGGEPLYQYRVNPFVIDLDRDGVNDLACGDGNGYVLFYRNTGTNSAPELAAAETLRSPAGLPVMSGGTAAYGSRCWFGYWDADTVPDILLSAYDGNVELFLGVLPVSVEEERTTRTPMAVRVGPNPTTGRSTSWCEAPASSDLVVCDNAGRVVRHLGVAVGDCAKVWDGRNDAGSEVNSGVYFCRLTGFGQAVSARIVVSR